MNGLLISTNITVKSELVFVLKQKKCLFVEVLFENQVKDRRFIWKSVLTVFKTALHWSDFYLKITGDFECLQYSSLEISFLIVQILDESTTIENANTTNRMTNIKWTYHKEWRFAINYFIFCLKFNFSIRASIYS